MIITPAQCRAARALLQWSQDDLESHAKVAKKTIADFERGAQIPYERTLKLIAVAIEDAGIEFISENGGGGGVRSKKASARLLRKRVSHFKNRASLSVSYQGNEYRVLVPARILDDLDRTRHKSSAELEASINQHLNLILDCAAAKINSGGADEEGNVLLQSDDFPKSS